MDGGGGGGGPELIIFFNVVGITVLMKNKSPSSTVDTQL